MMDIVYLGAFAVLLAAACGFAFACGRLGERK
jgi:hypothetical protein